MVSLLWFWSGRITRRYGRMREFNDVCSSYGLRLFQEDSFPDGFNGRVSHADTSPLPTGRYVNISTVGIGSQLTLPETQKPLILIHAIPIHDHPDLDLRWRE